ncbi:zf-DHHC-domain-containing protein [Flagelloscypha sp. PMI_526]|nr:zf-DHHC-domain-containing protein [Flagelloscypha sp. PMI_526]
MAGGWIGRVIIGFVLCLISFIAYSSQIFIIWPWYGSVLSLELLVLLVPFNLLVGMLLWNYYLCVVSDPGSVPTHWKPDENDDGFEVKKISGQPRFCRTCKVYKPPRAHHCRQCNRCVLRMDHHCPWIDNCVGHTNYGHFIRFLCYVDVACAYHVAMVTRRVLYAAKGPYWSEPSTTEFIFILTNYVACVPVLLAVGAFSIYHLLGLMGNTTTIESWEKDKAATLYRKGRIEQIKFPYNLGRRKNIESVLGPNPWLWCWPTQTPGSGLRFEATSDEEEPQSWPPKDPSENYEFKLPDSPWTYENEGVNPELRPRRRRKPLKNDDEHMELPPYHVDFDRNDSDESYEKDVESSGDDEYYEDRPKRKVRRGSEGFEIRPIAREEMLKRYLEEQEGDGGGGRIYNRYVPEPESESNSEDDRPLTALKN